MVYMHEHELSESDLALLEQSKANECSRVLARRRIDYATRSTPQPTLGASDDGECRARALTR